jgi:hypothetical protein
VTKEDRIKALSVQLGESARANLLLWVAEEKTRFITRLITDAVDPAVSDAVFRSIAVQLLPYSKLEELLSSHQTYARSIAELHGVRF